MACICSVQDLHEPARAVGRMGADFFRNVALELLLGGGRLRGLGKQLGVNRGVEVYLFELRGARVFAVLLVLVLVGHGQAVGGAPVGEIAFTIEGAGLSHALVLFAKNVSGLGIDVPADL